MIDTKVNGSRCIVSKPALAALVVHPELAAVVLRFIVMAAVSEPSRVTLFAEGVQVDFDGAPLQLTFTV